MRREFGDAKTTHDIVDQQIIVDLAFGVQHIGVGVFLVQCSLAGKLVGVFSFSERLGVLAHLAGEQVHPSCRVDVVDAVKSRRDSGPVVHARTQVGGFVRPPPFEHVRVLVALIINALGFEPPIVPRDNARVQCGQFFCDVFLLQVEQVHQRED